MRIPKSIINLAILINAGLCVYNLMVGDVVGAFMQACCGLALSVAQIVR
jgi:hypothetical protein